MHNKFIVLDHAVVWTGSWNLTINDTFRNNNNMLRLADEQLADNYTRKFQLLFAGKGGPGHPVELSTSVVNLAGYRIKTTFAPDNDITGEVVQAIKDARQSIDILAFTFTSDRIGDALLAARKRGVKIRVVIESRNASGTGSEYKRFKTNKLDVRQDGNCYVMHDKVIIIDGHEVITGSFNWTRQAQEQNDENALFIDNDGLAQHYANEFTNIYAQAVRPTKCGS
jgi:phosphatidylserine/phosphatidylglycerophosphate/cardiolipin synthase-like enzyme